MLYSLLPKSLYYGNEFLSCYAVEDSPLGSDNYIATGSTQDQSDRDRSVSPYVPENSTSEVASPPTTYTEISANGESGVTRSTRSPPPAYPGARALRGDLPRAPGARLPPLKNRPGLCKCLTALLGNNCHVWAALCLNVA